jgi:hypothetical protein
LDGLEVTEALGLLDLGEGLWFVREKQKYTLKTGRAGKLGSRQLS